MKTTHPESCIGTALPACEGKQAGCLCHYLRPDALALWSAVRSTALGCVERWQGRARLELSANNEKRRRAAALLQDLWRSDEHLQARLAANSARPALDGPWNTVAVVTATTTQKRIVFDKPETQAFYRVLLAQ